MNNIKKAYPKMNIKILNLETVKNMINNHGEFACVCYDTDTKYAEKVGESVLKSGHMSGSRGDYIKFQISGVSRAMIDQLIRKEVGTYKNVQSQRYVNKGFDYIIPQIIVDNGLSNFWNRQMDKLKEIKKEVDYVVENDLNLQGEKLNEVTRAFYPMSIESKVNIGFTIESLIDFMNERLCVLAQDEIRALAARMRDLVLEIEPRYKDLLVAKCDSMLYCPESKDRSCGRHMQKDELVDLINLKEEK